MHVGGSTASHEVHHLEPVACPEGRSRPLVTRHDHEIALHGHPVRRQLQPLQERHQIEALGDFRFLPVQEHLDQSRFLPQKGRLALAAGFHRHEFAR